MTTGGATNHFPNNVYWFACICGVIYQDTKCPNCKAYAGTATCVMGSPDYIARFRYVSYCSGSICTVPVTLTMSPHENLYCNRCNLGRSVKPLIIGSMEVNHDHKSIRSQVGVNREMDPAKVFKVSATFRDGSVSEASGDFKFATMNLDYLRQNLSNLTHVSFEDVSFDQRSTV